MKELSLSDYIQKLLKIQTKDGKLVNLLPNEPQLKLYNTFAKYYNEGKPCKIIILKARQMGFSTMTEAIISAISMTHSYTNSLIVAHDSDATTNIFNMTKRYYDNLPGQWKPMIKYSNAKLMDFENPSLDAAERDANPGLKSTIRVATAGHAGIGRSSTFQYMHLSEIAFWAEQDGRSVADQLNGLMQTLPQQGQSLLVIESTAKGYNYFKQLWDMAVAGDSEFIPLFFPWYEMRDYRREWNGEEFTDEEKVEQLKYSLTNEQIMWRRYAISTLCGGDINFFRQEYPGCPEEAFILTGTPFFNTSVVNKRLLNCEAPRKVGGFNENGHWYDSSAGNISIWEDPQPNHTYCIGSDTAGEGSDYFQSYVIDKDTLKQVASYRAVTDEKLFCEQTYWLGLHYNFALLAIETNFSTYPVQKLQDMGYVNIYVRETVDTYQERFQKKFGFRTTQLTRPLILDELKELVNETPDLINDSVFFNECLSFQKNDKGKPEATTGAHDDCVMAMAIAYHCLPQAQPVLRETSTEFTEEEKEELNFMNFGV